MKNILYIIILSIVLFCPLYSDAASSSNHFILNGSATISGGGPSKSPSYDLFNVIGRFSAFSTYNAKWMESGSYKWIASPLRPINPDLKAPIVTEFTIGTSSTLTVPITSLKADSNAGIIGYFISESIATPQINTAGWVSSVPSSYTFTSYGPKNLYVWAKDAAGNISAPKTASVAVVDPATAPVITVNAVPFPYYGKNITLSGTYSDPTGLSAITVANAPDAPVVAAINNGVWTASVTGLLLGTNSIIINAGNNIGNHTTVTKHIVIKYSGGSGASRKLTLADALRALHIANGDLTPLAGDLADYDLAPFVNERSAPDGIIDVGDAIVILKIIVGLI